MSKPRCYIAGPMSGYPQYNFPAFDAAKARLEAAGYEVVSPADLDRRDGFDGTGELPPHFTYRSRMKIDLPAICDCDVVAMLPGWERSPGAMTELSLATLIGCSVIDADTMEPMAELGILRTLAPGAKAILEEVEPC